MRDEILHQLTSTEFDVVIIGGGIHGAGFTQLAALGGLKVALLEAADYASGTSSRSSRILHGGLRYLELFDFRQVFDGIRARDDLLTTAPHLTTPQPFLFPIPAGNLLKKLQVKAGLTLYDLFLQDKRFRHRWKSRETLHTPLQIQENPRYSGAYQYLDGLMSGSRIVLECIRDARAHGACCLNYCEVKSVDVSDNGVELVFEDKRSNQESYTLRAKTVVNCAGPWAGSASTNIQADQIRYSRGSHILFDQPWEGPALILPVRGEKARYYFVLPHGNQTRVGTTEREVQVPERDPLPSPDEIDEILERLHRDLPEANLDKSSAYYCSAGIRTLVQKGTEKHVAKISRRHCWEQNGRELTLLGGKYTTFRLTVEEGFKLLCKHFKFSPVEMTLMQKPLPGAPFDKKNLREIEDRITDREVLPETIQMFFSRYGTLTEELLQFEDGLIPVSNLLFRGEVRMAIEQEQAETVEDILRRRSGVEYLPGGGIAESTEVHEILRSYPGGELKTTGIEHYQGRIQKIQQILS